MASMKVMASSTSRNSDLARRSSTKSPSIPELHLQNSSNSSNDGKSNANKTTKTSKDRHLAKNNRAPMTVDGLLGNVYGESPASENTLLDAEITLIDAAANIPNGDASGPSSTTRQESSSPGAQKTVDDVWKEIVAGGSERKECKEEAPDEMMTLEDFLAKAGAVEEEDVKVPPADRLSGGIFTFDPIPPSPYQPQHVEGSVIGFGNGVEVIGGRGKRRAVLEPLDKAAQQRQRRMIKNRESAARSRERKQAYQVELESLAARLEEENEQLLREKAERTKERFKQLMEKLVPIVEKRKPARALRRARSLWW
ncbi:G-box-binding factor 4-like isoform X2 [Malania oleifera]|uniref:G-box-binding factor 4-like isoform X2 n=1 Tax=Malania oleifera TaxID=397392 RepID=UPI0025AEB97C|nr:G-box-binding factor 4-like isoform X2 [Malania oleifera]